MLMGYIASIQSAVDAHILPVILQTVLTSSSAVAKRSRDASCPSVISFNNTKRRALSFIVSYTGVTLRLLVINISSSSPTINKLRRLLPAISVTTCETVLRQPRVDDDNTWSVAALTARSEARYRLRIAISAYPTFIRRPRLGGFRRNIAMPFGVEKLEWLGYPTVKKLKICLFVLTEFSNVTDRQTHTHRQTPHDNIGRSSTASRGKKHPLTVLR